MTTALLLVLLSAEPSRPKVGVSDFAAPKELAALAAAADSLVANELQRLGTFEVSTSDQLRTLLGYERQQQLLGCTDDSCSSNIGAAISQDYLVTGKLAKLGTGAAATFRLDLQLLSTKTGKREHGETVSGKTEQEVIGGVSPAVVKLVQSLLKERAGSLVVVSSEPAATVKIDDVVAGVTPLDGRVTVSGGPHIVRLEKDGFISWQKEVRIKAGEVTEETARMVPSPDTIREWEARQGRLRVGAYSATALAVVGVVAGFVMQSLATTEYGDASRGFVFYKSKLEAQVETEGELNYRKLAGDSRAKIMTYQTLSTVGFIVGGLSAAGAAALWIISDDPGKYRAYREVKLALTPAPGGGFAMISGRF